MARSVFITGGGRGIGLAVARAMAADGDRVAVGVRNGAAPDGLLGVACEVTDQASVDAAFAEVAERQGPVEVLVANAGITRDRLLPAMDDASMEEVLRTNLTGVMRTARAAAGGMIAARRGRVVLLSSALGFLGSPGQTNYAATKTGLLGFARSLAWELGSRGVTVNLVAPGIIDTDMTRGLSERRMRETMRMTPLGRTGTPEEVAAAVRFLASEEAGYITGAVLPVGGGIGMGV
ncbi:3-oxoacyl-ACP reductase FabG [Nocardiopsis sp. RSe5-2]|uniref:3-oxoacyl-ACP reductase FabG n=1 Tax=Nocardiopsis endophytica TaxID=3018445 RepID=A0ABT4TXH3_9ACTN|nr:3-oxoacyl-ACP reductase FabG [Nocardiopsis endophytica]MDA2809379.1 3-oxoacyl-ACP reductase FabG [Nocardiopsis endophytica]